MLTITFKGEPFLFTGDSFEEDGALTTVHDFTHGLPSYAHYWPASGVVKRYAAVIGHRADLVVLGPTEAPAMSFADVMRALETMLGGDSRWFEHFTEGDTGRTEDHDPPAR
jgi:hypothetical protein